jgi:hypothetical protein
MNKFNLSRSWEYILSEEQTANKEYKKFEFKNIRILSKPNAIDIYGELYKEAEENVKLIFSIYGYGNKFITQQQIDMERGDTSVKLSIELENIKHWNESDLYILNINYLEDNRLINCNNIKFGI